MTHSALDFFERPSVLINHEGSFDQEVFPYVGCSGPQLDFFVTADNKNCIALKRICLGLEIKLCNPDGKDAATADNVLFSNNTLHSLFWIVELFLNGKLLSSSSNNDHHAAFVETEVTTDPVNKKTWTVCQIYQYRSNKDKDHELKDNFLTNFANVDICFFLTYTELPMSTSWTVNVY